MLSHALWRIHIHNMHVVCRAIEHVYTCIIYEIEQQVYTCTIYKIEHLLLPELLHPGRVIGGGWWWCLGGGWWCEGRGVVSSGVVVDVREGVTIVVCIWY